VAEADAGRCATVGDLVDLVYLRATGGGSQSSSTKKPEARTPRPSIGGKRGWTNESEALRMDSKALSIIRRFCRLRSISRSVGRL
jgi:hypothetical protein